MQQTKKKYGLIVNYNAGKVQSGLFKKEYYNNLFGDNGIIRETKSIDDLINALKEFEHHQIDILFVYGGDGTHQIVVSYLFNLKINFSYYVPLKGGTMNMLSKDVGLGSSPDKVVKKIITQFEETKSLNIHSKSVLKIEGAEDKPLYGFFFANGTIYKLLNRYYENPSSVKNATRVVFESLIGSVLSNHRFSRFFDFINCTFYHDGKEVPHRQFLGLLVSTLNRVVFGITPFPIMAKKKSEINCVAYLFNRYKLIPYFIFLAKGIAINKKSILPFTAEKVSLECDTGFVLDGEVHHLNESKTIEIEVSGEIHIPVLN